MLIDDEKISSDIQVIVDMGSDAVSFIQFATLLNTLVEDAHPEILPKTREAIRLVAALIKISNKGD